MTVALLGMLFFTHSQFSIAAAPMSISVTITSSNSMSTIGVGDSADFKIVITPATGEMVTANTVQLFYNIGGASASSFTVTPTLDSGTTTDFSHTHMVEDGENGLFGITKVRFATNMQSLDDYPGTSGIAPAVTTSPSGSGITVDTIEDIADPTSIDVAISATGTPGTTDDAGTVISGETINVGVEIASTTNAALVATGSTLQYKIASGASADITLTNINATHLSGSLAVTSGTTAGAFTFISVSLNLNNDDGDGTAEVRMYDSSSDIMPTVTTTPTAGLTIDPVTAAADPTSIAVAISATGDDARVTAGEDIIVAVTVVDDTTNGGLLDSTAGAPVLNYKIGASGSEVPLTLVANGTTNWLGSVNVTNGFSGGDGTFTFVSVTLNLKNGAATDEPNADKVKAFEEGDNILTLTGDPLTVKGVFVVSDLESIDVNITADSDETLGIGDNITFTAKTVNGTDMDGNVLNVTVHYKVDKTAGSIVLTKGTGGLWSATLTITNTTGSGNLTFVSIDVGLENRDSMDELVRGYSATMAKITEALGITIDVAPAVVDNTTTSTTSSATSSAPSDSATSSSETISDSPVSIFAVFILIASVSMVVGIYTLRRRQ